MSLWLSYNDLLNEGRCLNEAQFTSIFSKAAFLKETGTNASASIRLTRASPFKSISFGDDEDFGGFPVRWVKDLIDEIFPTMVKQIPATKLEDLITELSYNRRCVEFFL